MSAKPRMIRAAAARARVGKRRADQDALAAAATTFLMAS
jgi:hypothetical protein